MRQHRFFIGQDLGSKKKVYTDSQNLNDPIVFDFDPMQIDMVDGLVAGKLHSKEAVIAHQRGVINQWKRVFRYQAGDSVVLFDGKIEVEAKIIELSKQNDTARLVLEREVKKGGGSVKTKSQIWLGLSILKGEHTDMVVEKATELGVSGIILIQTDRVIKKGANLERLQKIAIEAAEQCGRIDVPTVTTCEALELLICNDKTPTDYACGQFIFDRKIVFDMGGKDINGVVLNTDDGAENTIVCIGPEGGWSEKEKEYFKKLEYSGDIVIAGLGENVLRAETAAIVGLSAFYLR
jgi:16S rRNA (uracil1498-N3)-methyltransferase